MAIASSTAALLAMAAAAGATAYNTNRTAKRQDRQAAEGIRMQARRQQQADKEVASEIEKLESSNAAEKRAERLGQYMDQLARTRKSAEAGLTSLVGGEDFQADLAEARGDVADYGGSSANLMAGIDAAGLQREGEGISQSRLASRLGLIGRQSEGDAWINELRMRAIRRNPWIDAGASFLSGAAGGLGGGSGAAGPSAYNKAVVPPGKY